MKHFKLKELVDKKTFETMGEEAWKLFKPDALQALDDLREFFGFPVTVNNWHAGGTLQWRGFRTKEKAAALGSPNSRHAVGDAFDLDVAGKTAKEVRAIIVAEKNHPLLKKIMRLEDNVSWVHFDLKPVQNRIYLFRA